MDKKTIKKEILVKRNSLSEEEISQKSSIIKDTLFSTEQYQKAENILIYVSFGSEVETESVIENALSVGKRVFCPKVFDKKNRDMRFIKLVGKESFAEGVFGIKEPVACENSVFYTGEAFHHVKGDTLVVMPGVAFDRKRNRIGYSGGFYDTFLAANKGLETIALAFDLQILDETIDAEPHDIKPDYIITENGMIS